MKTDHHLTHFSIVEPNMKLKIGNKTDEQNIFNYLIKQNLLDACRGDWGGEVGVRDCFSRTEMRFCIYPSFSSSYKGL